MSLPPGNVVCMYSTFRIDILGFFSLSGVGSLYPVSGIMNPNKNIDVFQRKVMRDEQTTVPGGRGIFEQDLTLCHVAKKVKKVSQKKTNKGSRLPSEPTRFKISQ